MTGFVLRNDIQTKLKNALGINEPMKQKSLYRVTFTTQEKIYEVYARTVIQRELFGFVALEDLVFGETSAVVVDPGQEKLKNEFQGVKRTYVPMHAILRIDEVDKEGIAKITSSSKEGNVSQFPTMIYTKTPD
jgi:hypothetical protein